MAFCGQGSGQEPPSWGKATGQDLTVNSWGQQGLFILLAPGTSFGDVGMWEYVSPLQQTRTPLRAGCGSMILCAQKAGHDLGGRRSLWDAF